MKCKHKNHEDKNICVGGYNIPDGCVTEYDIYCKDCGVYLGHWAYGTDDLWQDKYNKWYNRLFYNIKSLIKKVFSRDYTKYNDNDIF